VKEMGVLTSYWQRRVWLSPCSIPDFSPCPINIGWLKGAVFTKSSDRSGIVLNFPEDGEWRGGPSSLGNGGMLLWCLVARGPKIQVTLGHHLSEGGCNCKDRGGYRCDPITRFLVRTCGEHVALLRAARISWGAMAVMKAYSPGSCRSEASAAPPLPASRRGLPILSPSLALHLHPGPIFFSHEQWKKKERQGVSYLSL
jgi:hypothetical protein